MSTPPAGHIELERAVDSITTGRRHRQDLGDLAPLIESIRRNGLLQPITITLDGHLICGARRLAAIRQLGWKNINVWVRGGVSDRLGQLLAEQDDNLLHKPLTQLEAAALYRELKALLAEDAARRQEATRFHTADNPDEDGGGNLPPPQFEHGKARSQAAVMVTGRDAHKSLERIGRLQDLADDESQPETVRQCAVREIEQIRAGGKVYPSHQRMNAELSLAELDHLAADPAQPDELREQARREAAQVRVAEHEAKARELEELAQAALARVKAAKTAGRRPKRPALTAVEQGDPVPFPLSVFTATWDDMTGWWLHYDPEQVGPALSEEQWTLFEQTIAGTIAFTNAARTARQANRRGEGVA
ncbi:ParB N-terminal domain-containing protein [Propionibacterium freudenreichii]|uniref:ParB N-terminal domain-containing protein n=1 Tax=Propionibacterium freudenreichii TaxID=1744 RepID=UPI0005A5C78A|nr:ParB/RepB/Spo0J family partition protein [Propionibacterium freudenreichii]MDK9332932.1 ParB N-terminal domain-containing protein [Propionibacterium freudenreichii]CEI48385.1 ParB-like nuclease [Propionibacterium freudenreichii]